MLASARLRAAAFAGLAAVVLASCSTHAGNASTDKEAETLARAISWPRKESVDGLVRAAAPRVVKAEELKANELGDPFARLVFLIHRDRTEAGWIVTDEVNACYEAEFGYYGLVGQTSRVDCPAGATAIVPTPIPPTARVVIPEGFDQKLRSVMAALPPSPTAAEVTARIKAAIPAPAVDAQTGLTDLPPAVESTVDGSDVGVAVRESYRHGCLLAARIAGKVEVGSLGGTQLEPGELGCSPESALRYGTLPPPH